MVDPIEVIRIVDSQDVEPAFEKIRQYAKRYYIAGYFAYELGYCFEKISSFSKRPIRNPYPLIHLCVFDKVVSFNHKTNRANLDIPHLFKKGEKARDFQLGNLRLNLSRSEYIKKIRRIKEYIKNGHTYQVNFAAKYRFRFSGSPFSFYQDLKSRQSVPYGAFCKFKDEFILSLSPELYFKREGLDIYSRPMKGTIRRGKDIGEDKEMALGLSGSIKDLAENIMIVDLMRNDLGRISKTGSVRASRLFGIERYDTLFQMTSSVRGILKKDTTYLDIFRNIFPGGSVTGAPKIRTMQIISELEAEGRNIYCGALGIIFPKDKAIFNMPIRTISLIKNKGEMGVGSGIVCDSDPQKEFQECLLKARFLTQRYGPFKLIETILWDGGKYLFLKEHLRRLEDSAAYFSFYFIRSRAVRQLMAIGHGLKKDIPYKIRLLLSKEGIVKIECYKILKNKTTRNNFIAVSRYRTDPENIFLYHKTTNRQLYDSEYKYYSRQGYYDVIFLNTRGEVTEGSISNIIIKLNKKYYTPAVSSGLLEGICRSYFIKKYNVDEKAIYLEDLLKAERILLCNSVRWLVGARIGGGGE